MCVQHRMCTCPPSPHRTLADAPTTLHTSQAPTGDPDTCVGDLHVTPLLNDWDSDGDVDVAILCAPLTSKLALTAKSTVLHYITTDATDEARVYGADAGSSGLGRFGATAGSYITTFAAGDVDSGTKRTQQAAVVPPCAHSTPLILLPRWRHGLCPV